ncbi:hypothetical protein DWX99_05200 [Firmicutes bacterium AF22-6AC]|nr:hypothetical protein DWX99_05200 [Firmicutes bacterium AF22-6AC]
MCNLKVSEEMLSNPRSSHWGYWFFESFCTKVLQNRQKKYKNIAFCIWKQYYFRKDMIILPFGTKNLIFSSFLYQKSNFMPICENHF